MEYVENEGINIDAMDQLESEKKKSRPTSVNKSSRPRTLTDISKNRPQTAFRVKGKKRRGSRQKKVKDLLATQEGIYNEERIIKDPRNRPESALSRPTAASLSLIKKNREMHVLHGVGVPNLRFSEKLADEPQYDAQKMLDQSDYRLNFSRNTSAANYTVGMELPKPPKVIRKKKVSRRRSARRRPPLDMLKHPSRPLHSR